MVIAEKRKVTTKTQRFLLAKLRWIADYVSVRRQRFSNYDDDRNSRPIWTIVYAFFRAHRGKLSPQTYG